MKTKEEPTVRKFMLKRFPTNVYMDCPVSKEYWEVIQEYAESYHQEKLKAEQSQEHPDLKELEKRLDNSLAKESFASMNEFLSQETKSDTHNDIYGPGNDNYGRDKSIADILQIETTIKKTNLTNPNTVMQWKQQSQEGEERYPDTEADGYVFCGKCGKMKDI